MSWESDILGAFPVGTEATAPAIAEKIAHLHDTYPKSGVRSKVYTVLSRNVPYGIVERLGLNEDGERLWRRRE